ncbi:MAG: glycosyltransferase family 9 protein [Planctomycetota bacterium]|jgi:heptosyltransferase-2|nr:glycosyltransferase family 9 protein [Planctomycetota bacterium]
MQIIVRAPNWLGDAIMALPVFAALRAAYPDASIVAAARENLRAVFTGAADEFLAVPRGAALLKNALTLRSRSIDLGVLLTNSFATAAWLFLTGTKRRVGYARDARGFLLTDAIKPTPEILAAHQADYYFALLKKIGGARENAPRLTVDDAAASEAAKFLAAKNLTAGDYAVIAPCSAFGAVKDWAIERYAAVAARLYAERQIPALFTGTAGQREMINAVAGAGVSNAAGELTLGGLFGVLRSAKFFLGGDSGAAHAAAALDVPAFVIFGITEPSRTRPLGGKVQLIGKGGLATPDLRSPVIQRAARQALDAITVEEVVEAIFNLIKN